MPELMRLRDLTEQIVPPGLDDLRSVAGARQRRTAGVVAAGGTALTIVVASLLMADSDRRTLPPTPQPITSVTPQPTTPFTPQPTTSIGSMTPREVVEDPDARLAWAATSWSDPDVRIAAWVTVCDGCKKPEESRSRPSFMALALTTDGYETTTYAASSGIPDGVSTTVTSPTDDAFLVKDDGNAREWLVSTDGTVTHVDRVEEPIDPVDERHWFECSSVEQPGPQWTWCTLDVDSATAYQWPARWGGGLPSGARPDAGVEPWGIENGADGDGLDAWWDNAGERRATPLTQGYTWAGIVRVSPTGGPLWWTRAAGSDEMVLHDGRDRSGNMDEVSRPGPETSEWFTLTGTASGALLAWSTWPTVAVWRADDLEADFELVYSGATSQDQQQPTGTDLVEVDGRLLFGSLGEALVSEDDGRSWSVTSTWR